MNSISRAADAVTPAEDLPATVHIAKLCQTIQLAGKCSYLLNTVDPRLAFQLLGIMRQGFDLLEMLVMHSDTPTVETYLYTANAVVTQAFADHEEDL